MRSFNIQTDPEELDRNRFVPIKGDDWKINRNFRPRFDYKFLNVHVYEKYCVCQKCLKPEIYHAYFEKVNKYSNKTVNELEDERHFNIKLTYRGLELDIYKQLVGIDLDHKLTDEENPMIGHFPLWTSEESSPRVFFFVGKNAVFHIMYIDHDHGTHRTDHRPSR